MKLFLNFEILFEYFSVNFANEKFFSKALFFVSLFFINFFVDQNYSSLLQPTFCYRSSLTQIFYKMDVLKSSVKLIGKQRCRLGACNYSKGDPQAVIFFCEFYKIF